MGDVAGLADSVDSCTAVPSNVELLKQSTEIHAMKQQAGSYQTGGDEDNNDKSTGDTNDDRADGDEDKISNWPMKSMRLFLVFINVTYLGMASTMLTWLNCVPQPGDGQMYHTLRPYHDCDEVWRWGAGIPGLLLFGLGIPALFSFMIMRRRQIAQTAGTVDLRFMYAMFQPRS